ncbi:MAG: DUF3460 family protein [Pseudomonadota bacterium]
MKYLRHYESEFSRFMQAYLARHPEVPDDQRHGWYLLWDKQVDFDDLARAQNDTVPDKPYHYE